MPNAALTQQMVALGWQPVAVSNLDDAAAQRLIGRAQAEDAGPAGALDGITIPSRGAATAPASEVPPTVPAKPAWWPPGVPWPPMTAGKKGKKGIPARPPNPATGDRGDPGTPDEPDEPGIFNFTAYAAIQRTIETPNAPPYIFRDPSGDWFIYRGTAHSIKKAPSGERFVDDPVSGERWLIDANDQPHLIIPRTADQVKLDWLLSGNVAGALALDGFMRRPTDQQMFDAALAYARSPADIFTISNIAHGSLTLPPPPVGQTQRIGPQADFLTQAWNRMQANYANPFQGFQFPGPQRGPTPITPPGPPPSGTGGPGGGAVQPGTQPPVAPGQNPWGPGPMPDWWNLPVGVWQGERNPPTPVAPELPPELAPPGAPGGQLTPEQQQRQAEDEFRRSMQAPLPTPAPQPAPVTINIQNQGPAPGGGGGTAPPTPDAHDIALEEARQRMNDAFRQPRPVPSPFDPGSTDQGPVPAFARGGRMAKTGRAVVGEQGPEMVRLPRGAQVTPMGQIESPFDYPMLQHLALGTLGFNPDDDANIQRDDEGNPFMYRWPDGTWHVTRWSGGPGPDPFRRFPRGVGRVQAGGALGRPKSLLSAAGITLPSAQAWRNLLPSEQSVFREMGRTAGIPLDEINQELAGANPGGRRLSPFAINFQAPRQDPYTRPYMSRGFGSGGVF